MVDLQFKDISLKAKPFPLSRYFLFPNYSIIIRAGLPSLLISKVPLANFWENETFRLTYVYCIPFGTHIFYES